MIILCVPSYSSPPQNCHAIGITNPIVPRMHGLMQRGVILKILYRKNNKNLVFYEFHYRLSYSISFDNNKEVINKFLLMMQNIESKIIWNDTFDIKIWS